MLKHISNIPGVLKVERFTESDLSKKYHIENTENNFKRLCGVNHGWGNFIAFGDVIDSAIYDLSQICPDCLEEFCKMADGLNIQYGDTVKIVKITQINDTCDGFEELSKYIGQEYIIEDIAVIRGYQITNQKKPEDLFVFSLKGTDDNLWCYNELTLVKKADKETNMNKFFKLWSIKEK